ncbi:MAG: hypothetical protein ACOYYJ_20820 [Chloroflexota bacterium]
MHSKVVSDDKENPQISQIAQKSLKKSADFADYAEKSEKIRENLRHSVPFGDLRMV